jgi:hypothetical protein
VRQVRADARELSLTAARRSRPDARRPGGHDPKPAGVDFAERNADDVQPIAVLELDHLTRRALDKPYDSVEEHLVCQIHAGSIDLPGTGAGQRGSIRSAAVMSTRER